MLNIGKIDIGGGSSGAGSYNRLAEFKAEILNDFVKKNGIKTVIEWGCGDGAQLGLAEYANYIGYDISECAINICKKKFENDESKKFFWCGSKTFKNTVKADLSISLDVIYHLVEDDVYKLYLDRLFSSSDNYVCIYSCNFKLDHAEHVKCRKFTDYVENNYVEWKLIKIVTNRYPYTAEDPNNTSWSDFYFYKKEKKLI